MSKDYHSLDITENTALKDDRIIKEKSNSQIKLVVGLAVILFVGVFALSHQSITSSYNAMFLEENDDFSGNGGGEDNNGGGGENDGIIEFFAENDKMKMKSMGVFCPNTLTISGTKYETSSCTMATSGWNGVYDLVTGETVKGKCYWKLRKSGVSSAYVRYITWHSYWKSWSLQQGYQLDTSNKYFGYRWGSVSYNSVDGCNQPADCFTRVAIWSYCKKKLITVPGTLTGVKSPTPKPTPTPTPPPTPPPVKIKERTGDIQLQDKVYLKKSFTTNTVISKDSSNNPSSCGEGNTGLNVQGNNGDLAVEFIVVDKDTPDAEGCLRYDQYIYFKTSDDTYLSLCGTADGDDIDCSYAFGAFRGPGYEVTLANKKDFSIFQVIGKSGCVKWGEKVTLRGHTGGGHYPYTCNADTNNAATLGTTECRKCTFKDDTFPDDSFKVTGWELVDLE